MYEQTIHKPLLLHLHIHLHQQANQVFAFMGNYLQGNLDLRNISTFISSKTGFLTSRFSCMQTEIHIQVGLRRFGGRGRSELTLQSLGCPGAGLRRSLEGQGGAVLGVSRLIGYPTLIILIFIFQPPTPSSESLMESNLEQVAAESKNDTSKVLQDTFPPKITISGAEIRPKEAILVSLALALLVFSICLFFKHWSKNYRDINTLPYYAYLYKVR